MLSTDVGLLLLRNERIEGTQKLNLYLKYLSQIIFTTRNRSLFVPIPRRSHHEIPVNDWEWPKNLDIQTKSSVGVFLKHS